jgi:hypothetical protein
MQLSAIAKGVAVGAAAGTVGYFVSTASGGKKARLKRRTLRAVHAVSAVMDSIADFWR